MPLEGEYEPSPWEPIAEQVELYERTDGVEGADFMGGPCIILTTKGAKSAKLRKTPLIRVTDGTSYAVVGSFDYPPHDAEAPTFLKLSEGFPEFVWALQVVARQIPLYAA